MGVILALSFLMMMGFVRCATEKKAEIHMVWPLPPDPPRIKYVKSFENAKVVLPEKRFFKKAFAFLFGEEEVPGMIQPYGIFVSREGNVFVSDTGVQVIHVFNFKEKSYRQIFKIPGGRLLSPIGIALDPEQNIYVSDSVLGRIFQFNPDGQFKKVWETPFTRPTGIAIDPKRLSLYVVDTVQHHVLVFNLKGEKLFEIGKRGNGEGEFNYPTHVAVNPENGDIYVSDSMNFRIQQFSPEGKYIKKFGSLGNQIGSFSKPKGIAVDSRGNVYVVDGLYDTVQLFNSKGDLLMNFGKAGNKEGEFWLPAGIAVQGETIYVADTYNKRVEVFQAIDISSPLLSDSSLQGAHP